ncbi:DUF1524 domain-containing protein [Paracoccus sp. S-4012]|uniref:GmrSD restriction endonuclease domain-containing protein n=1 Tax=Paracoccus sp. S-4012 TaxID=2665648 RepID=UPI0012B12F5A|nr:DUF1524 domain-containing protein [Paracoccus sp. S-4012]MRX52264.1 DUF1524 domain-containing protein [Paracoccus sp. S-4012]
MERLLWLIEVLAVRYFLIGRGRPERIESLGARVAKMIVEGQVSTATEVREELDELYIPDDAFELAFQTRDETDCKKIGYLLRSLERQARQQRQDVHFREMTPNAVTVEHIMPKSPGHDWKGVFEAHGDGFHEEYLTGC